MSDWKYTIPVMRAEERADGLYLVGEAAGPEVASDTMELSPQCVANVHEQIIQRMGEGNPFAYRDNHGRGSAAMADLGWVVDGEVNPVNYHLKVSVKLDEDNPAAVFTHTQVKRGKRFGMSVEGRGSEWEVVRAADGKSHVRINHLELNEISHTTAPSWVPSFGTVIARSLDGEGVEQMKLADTLAAAAALESTETPAPETTAPVETAPETPVVERAEEAPVEADPTPDPAATETVEPVEAPVVERGRIGKGDRNSVIAMIRQLSETFGVDLSEVVSQINAEAITQTETPALPAAEVPVALSADEGDEHPAADDLVEIEGIKVERSVAALYMKLTDKIAEKDALIEQLVNMPAGQVPAPVVRSKFGDGVKDALEDMTPEERLRFGLRGMGYTD